MHMHFNKLPFCAVKKKCLKAYIETQLKSNNSITIVFSILLGTADTRVRDSGSYFAESWRWGISIHHFVDEDIICSW